MKTKNQYFIAGVTIREVHEKHINTIEKVMLVSSISKDEAINKIYLKYPNITIKYIDEVLN